MIHYSILNTLHSSLSTQDASLITHHSSLSTQHSALITHHSPLITHHSSLITHHSSLITHHSSLITHHSSRITHHSSLLRRDSSLSASAIRTCAHLWRSGGVCSLSSPKRSWINGLRAKGTIPPRSPKRTNDKQPSSFSSSACGSCSLCCRACSLNRTFRLHSGAEGGRPTRRRPVVTRRLAAVTCSS